MTTADLLARCQARGVELAAGSDGSLLWEADADPPADLLQALAERKAEVLDLLRAREDEQLARLIERDQGLRPGTLALLERWRMCGGCDFCRGRSR